MEQSDIHAARINDSACSENICLMDQEIPGTKVCFAALAAGTKATREPSDSFIRVFFVCSGVVVFRSSNFSVTINQPGVYIADPSLSLEISVAADAEIVELYRYISPFEYQLQDTGVYPYSMVFSEAPKYTEDCKSAKTISRMIVPTGIVPRFAMGSVETYGDDRVEKHSHPMLEQFFFGLQGNDCTIMIDDLDYPFGSDHLVHIPLGSGHGIKSAGSQRVYYLWMDFLFDDEGQEYMANAHRMIDPV